MDDQLTVTFVGALVSLDLTYKLLILAALIFLGATSYAFNIRKQAIKDELAFGWFDYFQNLMGGIFSGCIFFLLCLFVLDNELVAWLGGGIGSAMGIPGIMKVGDIFLSTIEARFKSNERN